MSNDIVIEVITGVVTLIAAFITSNIAVSRQLTKTLDSLQIKVDLLWEIYIKDAIKAARRLDLVKENSPIITTDRGRNLIPRKIREEIDKQIKSSLEESQARSLMREIIKNHLDVISLVSIENDISIQALLGIIEVMIMEHLESRD